jgi:hypothetical protein
MSPSGVGADRNGSGALRMDFEWREITVDVPVVALNVMRCSTLTFGTRAATMEIPCNSDRPGER